MDEMQNIVELCRQADVATRPLTHDGAFHIYKLEYNERAFGDIVVVLQPAKGFDFRIRFVRDRDFPRCEISPDARMVWENVYRLKEDWQILEHVLEALGIPKPETSRSFEEMMPRWSKLIRDNIQKLNDAYAPANYEHTRELIEKQFRK
jgi:hypothetical protein